MNKINIIAKTVITGLACTALCGATFAAPHGGGNAPGKAPMHQKAPAAPKGGRAHTPAPRPAAHGAPVARRTPAPAPRHHAPPPPPAPKHHHGGHRGDTGLLAIGAAVIGGIVGGIISACR